MYLSVDCEICFLILLCRQLVDKVAAAGYDVVEQAVDFAKKVIQALKEKGVTKIGAAGFCWGAKVVVELAKDGEIQFAALLHPSFVTLDDIKGVKVPIGILGAEIDKRSPPELVEEFEAALLCHILFFNR
ncbi:putative dienelactone hydrolase, alpha/Beta hydrolase [Helianthus annuus]|nr:putative dienelactone hydrolase, alpha/Beta hydrolase [Helianthus annuus]